MSRRYAGPRVLLWAVALALLMAAFLSYRIFRAAGDPVDVAPDRDPAAETVSP